MTSHPIIDNWFRWGTGNAYNLSFYALSKNLAAFQVVGKLTEAAQMYRHLLAGCNPADKLHVIIFAQAARVLADLMTHVRININSYLLANTQASLLRFRIDI